MQITKLKIILFLVIALINCYHLAQADTKILRQIHIPVKNGLSEQTISLENDKYLSINGFSVQRYDIPDDPKHELKATIEYVADKDGYKVNFNFIQQESLGGKRLNPSTLKSLGG
ncbi:uncharacterized protein LOC142219669 [Haematobia irritans]|uniref:uncharacterized protein LOC142219669 n=1 Tax=Haematobia irritans TaxID=7368 RepID=UPI003F50399B